MHQTRKTAISLGALLCFCLLFTPLHAALSSSDAIEFVRNQNHFLQKGDDTEQPTVPIIQATKKYWVIPVLEGTDIATYLPVLVAEPELMQAKATNEQLFTTAQFLRSYIQYKSQLATQNKRWFLGSDNQLILTKLSRDLRDEIYNLNIVKSEFSDGGDEITVMQSQLNDLSASAQLLSQSIFEFIQAENAFVSEPENTKILDLKTKAENAFETLFEHNAKAEDYISNVGSLKLKISQSSLTAEQKSNFIKLVEPPAGLETLGSTSIGNWVIVSQETQARITAIYNEAKSKTFLDNATNEFNIRVSQNQSYELLYGQDDEFKQKTQYPTLETSLKDLLSDAKKTTWKNQDQLKIATDTWDSAVTAYNNQQFDLVAPLAAQSKRAVQRVIEDGIVETTPEGINFEQIINIAIYLVILIAIVYFLANRDKIFGAIAKPQAEQGVDLNAWKKMP